MADQCSRKACRANLTGRPYMRIWNDASTDIPRAYCIPCGRKIVEGARGQLKHEVANTHVPTDQEITDAINGR